MRRKLGTRLDVRLLCESWACSLMGMRSCARRAVLLAAWWPGKLLISTSWMELAAPSYYTRQKTWLIFTVSNDCQQKGHAFGRTYASKHWQRSPSVNLSKVFDYMFIHFPTTDSRQARASSDLHEFARPSSTSTIRLAMASREEQLDGDICVRMVVAGYFYVLVFVFCDSSD